MVFDTAILGTRERAKRFTHYSSGQNKLFQRVPCDLAIILLRIPLTQDSLPRPKIPHPRIYGSQNLGDLVSN